MKLENNNELCLFIKELFYNKTINQKAPEIIKFFIITRNYGLINLRSNIEKLYLERDFEGIVADAILDGFKQDNIPYNAKNIIKLLITNYHENGFYYYSFPGFLIDYIQKNGIPFKLGSAEIQKIINKYKLESDFNYSFKVVEYLDNRKTYNNAFNFPLKNINSNEIKEKMLNNKYYKNDDYYKLYTFVEQLLRKYIESEENLGIALIEKKKVEDYFGKPMDAIVINPLSEFVNKTQMSDKEIIRFITETLCNHENEVIRTIPPELLNIFTYEIMDSKKEIKKSK